MIPELGHFALILALLLSITVRNVWRGPNIPRLLNTGARAR